MCYRINYCLVGHQPGSDFTKPDNHRLCQMRLLLIITKTALKCREWGRGRALGGGYAS